MTAGTGSVSPPHTPDSWPLTPVPSHQMRRLCGGLRGTCCLTPRPVSAGHLCLLQSYSIYQVTLAPCVPILKQWCLLIEPCAVFSWTAVSILKWWYLVKLEWPLYHVLWTAVSDGTCLMTHVPCLDSCVCWKVMVPVEWPLCHVVDGCLLESDSTCWMTPVPCCCWQLGAGSDWYLEVLSHASLAGHATELVRKVQQDISSASFNKR